MLKKIECFVQPGKLEPLKDALVKVGVEGLSVSDVRGFGRHMGYRDQEETVRAPQLLSKTKLEIVVEEEIVDHVVEIIKDLARTGTIGAGKIFVLPVEDALRISTEEVGKSALH